MNENLPTSIPSLSQAEAMILQSLSELERQVTDMSGQLEEMKDASKAASVKDWYTTGELAQAMGVTGHTVSRAFGAIRAVSNVKNILARESGVFRGTNLSGCNVVGGQLGIEYIHTSRQQADYFGVYNRGPTKPSSTQGLAA